MKKTNLRKNENKTPKAKCQTQAGITLIALIITVIILLILAGTAISISINGGDLFGRSQNAVGQYNNRVAEEENKINEVWSILNTMDKTDDSVGIVVNHNGTEVDISKIPANNIADYYGDYVVNYTKGGTYQLYYVDNEGYFGDTGRIYIQNTEYNAPIADYSISSGIKLSDHYEITGLRNINSLVYKLNPDWAREIGTSLTTLTDDEIPQKLKGIAYLCNTANWNSRYVTLEDQSKGLCAIGGIPAEMFCLSYNARVKPSVELSAKAFSEDGYYTIGYEYKPVSGTTTTNGYARESSSTYTETANSMYLNTASDSYSKIWMCSPSAASQYVCSLKKHNLSFESTGGYGHIRAVVSIPSDYRVTGDAYIRTAKFVDNIVGKTHGFGTYSQITQIVRSTAEPSTNYKHAVNLVSTEESDYSIYMWNDNNTLYWYSEFEHPVLPADCGSLFGGFSSLEYANGIRDFDTSNVINMGSMFSGCSKLKEADVSQWNTSNVTNMYYMFGNCYKLGSLDVSNWNTSNVTNMQYMFGGCFEIANLNVSNWETLKVTNMASLFSGCFKLTFLDLSNWDTSCVTNMNSMFTAAEALQKIIASDKFTVERVTDSENMFSGCTALKGGNNTSYDNSKKDKVMAHIDTAENPGYFSSN